MPNIIFTKGGVSFQFSKGRVYPVDDPAQVNVPVDYSEGGQLYAYDKGIEEQFFNLEFENLPAADHLNYFSFFLNTIVGPANTFTYTDEDGVAHTVRNMDTKYPLRKSGAGGYSGTIALRKEI